MIIFIINTVLKLTKFSGKLWNKTWLEQTTYLTWTKSNKVKVPTQHYLSVNQRF